MTRKSEEKMDCLINHGGNPCNCFSPEGRLNYSLGFLYHENAALRAELTKERERHDGNLREFDEYRTSVGQEFKKWKSDREKVLSQSQQIESLQLSERWSKATITEREARIGELVSVMEEAEIFLEDERAAKSLNDQPTAYTSELLQRMNKVLRSVEQGEK